MRKTFLFALIVAAAAAVGADPAGGTGPQYCWLGFGPQGKVRVLVRLDGEAVTLEHYAGDRPTGRKERFTHRNDCKDVTINDPDGRTSYLLTRLGGTVAKPGAPADLIASVSIKGPVAYRQYCDIPRMSDKPKGAPEAPFHGPLTAGPVTVNWKLPPSFVLRLGDEPTVLQALVGTMDAAKGCWVVVRSHEGAGEKMKSAFPAGTHPFVDVEFPAKKPGDPPVKRRYPLNELC
jgi:hypothetical protein